MTEGSAARGVALSPQPCLDVLLDWLRSPAVVRAGGAVRSWTNPEDGGYDYPEVGGLWLSHAARYDEPASERLAESVASWLDGIVARDGAVGRDGTRYLFDSAVVLAGLIDHASARRTTNAEESLARLYEFLAASVRAGAACTPQPGGSALRWSTCFGAHLLKVVIALGRYGDLTGSREAESLVAALVDTLLPLFDGERFRSCPQQNGSYQHGFLYALEGLCWLDETGRSAYGREIAAGASWLAENQRADGGIPAFADERGAHGPARADATAQAVRLWTLRDPERWSKAIDAGLAFLGGLQEPEGGIRYEPDSLDVNVWVSLFTAQALAWQGGGASAEQLF